MNAKAWIYNQLEMWANAQRDGRSADAEYS